MILEYHCCTNTKHFQYINNTFSFLKFIPFAVSDGNLSNAICISLFSSYNCKLKVFCDFNLFVHPQYLPK